MKTKPANTRRSAAKRSGLRRVPRRTRQRIVKGARKRVLRRTGLRRSTVRARRKVTKAAKRKSRRFRLRVRRRHGRKKAALLRKRSSARPDDFSEDFNRGYNEAYELGFQQGYAAGIAAEPL